MKPNSIKIFLSPESEEWMVQFPSGKVQFLGFWGVIKVIWAVLKREGEIVIVDKDGTESVA